LTFDKKPSQLSKDNPFFDVLSLGFCKNRIFNKAIILAQQLDMARKLI